jgi:hypothetical protein
MSVYKLCICSTLVVAAPLFQRDMIQNQSRSSWGSDTDFEILKQERPDNGRKSLCLNLDLKF